MKSEVTKENKRERERETKFIRVTITVIVGNESSIEQVKQARFETLASCEQ